LPAERNLANHSRLGRGGDSKRIKGVAMVLDYGDDLVAARFDGYAHIRIAWDRVLNVGEAEPGDVGKRFLEA